MAASWLDTCFAPPAGCSSRCEDAAAEVPVSGMVVLPGSTGVCPPVACSGEALVSMHALTAVLCSAAAATGCCCAWPCALLVSGSAVAGLDTSAGTFVPGAGSGSVVAGRESSARTLVPGAVRNSVVAGLDTAARTLVPGAVRGSVVAGLDTSAGTFVAGAGSGSAVAGRETAAGTLVPGAGSLVGSGVVAAAVCTSDLEPAAACRI